MKACPITFEHPSQAKELHGIGPKLCDRLTEKLEAHCKENGTTMPEDPLKGTKRSQQRPAVVADRL
jgi:crossover junction endonuclease MUS81